VHRVRPEDGLRAGPREADVPYLARLDLLKVDVVDAEPAEAGVELLVAVLGPSVRG
jgi:hypothetical protein